MGVILSKQFAKRLDLDGALKRRAWDFVLKVMTDPTSPGLHIEPIVGSRDSRVRTGRVNDGYRAVMFLVREEPEAEFVLAAIDEHDRATKLAERIVLRPNPVNGVLEVLTETDEVPSAGSGSPRPSPAEGSTGPLASFRTAELEAAGIGAGIAAQAVAAADDDALLGVAAGAPAWQGEVLLALATGTALGDVLDRLALPSAAAAAPIVADESVEAALARPASRMEFVRIETDDELRRVLEGSFADWRVFLHPEQRGYAYRAGYTGAFRLSGGAGTGKTVVALHRARHLATADRDARVVLTTFTTTLATNLRRDLRTLDPNVRVAHLGQAGVLVAGVDKLALDVLSSVPEDVRLDASRGLVSAGGSLKAVADREERVVWEDAIRQAGFSGDLARPTFLTSEYRMVVLAADVQTKEDYLKVPRPGRGTRLSRADRANIWTVIETYRRLLALQQAASFAEIAVVAARAADIRAAREGHRLADHVIVDEAQDLHAGHWRLLRALVAEGPDDLFICEDSHQRIYGEKVVLSRFGIAVRGRSRRLTLNYRTTVQNLRFAVGILAGVDVADLEGQDETTDGYRSTTSGPTPVLRRCGTLSDEMDVVAATVRDWLGETRDGEPVVEPDTIGILTRTAPMRDLVAQGLRDRGLSAQVVGASESSRSDAPRLMTMHRAKGLEFSRAVLFGADRGSMPLEHVLRAATPDERRDARDRERFLLYVAASRARDALVVTWTGDPSPFLPSPA